MAAALGWSLTAPVPDVDDQIALGYTAVRFYSASSEAGSYSLASSSTLVSGTLEYTYNNTVGAAADWVQWCLYGATPGEGVRSQPQPVSPLTYSLKTIRQGVGARLGLCSVYTLASVSSSTAAIISDLIDPDASAHSVANRIVRIVGGTAIGQTRRIRTGSTGYTVASGTVTINRATSPAWVAGDEVEIWKPLNDGDSSTIVDAAITAARGSMAYEADLFIICEDSKSEYPLPVGISERMVKRVEWAARGTSTDSYPDDPDWRVVPFARVSGSPPILSIYATEDGALFTADTIIRVTYFATPDRLDSDSDTWTVPDLDWAIAEAALRTVVRLSAISNSSAEKSLLKKDAADLLADCVSYRKAYWPQTAGVVVPAR